MEYAIDRYTAGKEIEVSAKSFSQDGYIPARKDRFFCPECGEKVFFRNGGRYKSAFFHQKKTAKTPECEKRIDSQARISLSQRVGLPVYLVNDDNSFKLAIGFPALGAELLEKAEKAGCTAEICTGNTRQKLQINKIRFLENDMTLIPVKTIPPANSNFKITITGMKDFLALQCKWADYADGFAADGAVFSYSETGGKKIRYGGSIAVNKIYYAVLTDNIPDYAGIRKEYSGSFVVNNTRYYVNKFYVNVSSNDTELFKKISDYLQKKFKVWLLDSLPEIVPIWPPAVTRDAVIPVKHNSSLICAVYSDNNEPDIYHYTYNGFFKGIIDTAINDVKLLAVKIGSKPQVLSVDRKYTGREVTFKQEKLPDSDFEYKISLNADEKVILDNHDAADSYDIDKELLSKAIAIKTNAKMELYTIKKGMVYHKEAIRTDKICVEEDKKRIGLLLLAEGRKIFQVTAVSINSSCCSNEQFIDLITTPVNGKMIVIPRWADTFIRQIKKNKENTLYNMLIARVQNGKLPESVLKQLLLLQLKQKNAIKKG